MTDRAAIVSNSPARPDPRDLSMLEQWREDKHAVETRLRANDALQIVVELAEVVGHVPEEAEAVTATAVLYETVLQAQAKANLLDAMAKLAAAKNEDADGRALRDFVNDGGNLITNLKLPRNKVEAAEKKVAEAERIDAAVRREARNSRVDYHNYLRTPGFVKFLADAWRDLYVDEEELLDLTARQGNLKREAMSHGHRVIEAAYLLSLNSPTNADKTELKRLFAEAPPEMPTIDILIERRKELEAASPKALEAARKEQDEAIAKAANERAGAMAGAARMGREDVGVFVAERITAADADAENAAQDNEDN